jgi:alpha-glucoside transport system permease protein
MRVVLPLGMPAITVAIFSQLRRFGSNIDLIAPASFVSLAIPLALLFVFQRNFVQGLLAGAVK